MNNITIAFSVTACKMSKRSLELLFSNVATVVTSKAVTITTNPGADSAVSKTTCVTTAGSVIVTQSATTGIVAGMIATGTGTPLTTPIAVTFTDAGDLVNLTAHGLSNGDLVSFPAITTTTGIVINTTYYVVGVTTNTFQVALTSGGAAINLVTNGSGTLRYRAIVVSVVANTSITFDRPMTSTASNTLTFRLLDTSTALMRNWTITG